ncbi:hypothetical protein Tco_0748795 [Tanacetum coccineum]|uniref:Uncharacterized protein n=1 Tax=Tanacetum coccineum TaxID=301880 RepID=A0ABQ4YWM2_9ASTR
MNEAPSLESGHELRLFDSKTLRPKRNLQPEVKACSFMLCDLDFEPLSLSLSSLPSCDSVYSDVFRRLSHFEWDLMVAVTTS